MQKNEDYVKIYIPGTASTAEITEDKSDESDYVRLYPSVSEPTL